MLKWITKNKEWLFSGVAVAVITAGIGLFWPDNSTPPVHQTHSGGGDNVAGDKIVHQLLLGSVDYQQLLAEIKDGEELLAGIALERTDLRLKQSAKLEELRKRLEDFKADVFRLHELFTRIPINTERLRQAKAHFNKGEFREANAVLNAEEIRQDVERLKLEKHAAEDRLAAVRKDLDGLASEFLLKARLSLVTPLEVGEDRFRRTEGYFEQALAVARTAEALFAYAKFLQEHNAFKRAEPLYQEALKHYRSLAKKNPETFLPDVARTLNNLAIVHANIKEYDGLALKESEEALKLFRSLAETDQKVFLPNVGMTLNNMAMLHRRNQSFGQALKEFEEALKILKILSQSAPKDFRFSVAATLNNMAILHYQIKGYGPAMKEFEESLKIRRSLAETEPKVFLPKVASTLNNLALLHVNTQEYGIALQEYEEALEISRSFAEAEPRAFLPHLTGTLINLSIFYLYAVTDRAKSVAYAQEAGSILIPLCKQVPHLQSRLDMAERLLKANAGGPAAE